MRMINYIAGTNQQCKAVLTAIDYWTDGIVKITAYTNEKTVSASVIKQIGSTAQTKNWAFGAWNDLNGYPSNVSFFQSRLVFAGTYGQPQTLWLSTVDDFENFKTGTKDDESLTFTINDAEVNAVQWLIPQKKIVIGTKAAVSMLGSSEDGQPITSEKKQFTTEVYTGSDEIGAIRVDDVILYVQRQKKYIRELAYNFESDGYVAPNMNILAEHILQSGIKQMTYQQNPYSIVWCLKNSGEIAGFTYNRSQDITAWHRHTTQGKFHALAVITETDGDQLWCIAERSINGTQKRFIEMFIETEYTGIQDGWFLDSALKYSGTETDTFTGLNHMEGENITIFANGVSYERTVTNGSVTISEKTSEALAGFPYTSQMTTMPLEIVSQKSDTKGSVKRISQAEIRFIRTLGCQIGINSMPLENVIFRNASSIMDRPLKLFTGSKVVFFPSKYDKEQKITVKQSQPMPCDIIAVTFNMGVYG